MDVKKLIIDTVRNRLSSEGVKPDEIIALRLTFESGKAYAKVSTKRKGEFNEPLSGTVNKSIRFIFLSKLNRITKKKLNKEFEKLVLNVNFESEAFTILGIDTIDDKPNVVDITDIAKIF